MMEAVTLPMDKIGIEAGQVGPAARSGQKDFRFVLLLSLIHVPLGVGLYDAGSLALIHPAAVVALGLYFALSKRQPLTKVAFVAAYIVGAEVLWRMAAVPVFWETGKYASGLIMVLALVRRKKFEIPKLPLLYLVLLIPACVLTIADATPSRAFETLSFNMSGPTLLLISCWFFSNVQMDAVNFRRMLLAMILPLLSVALSAAFYTVTAEELSFTDESSLATSGGFGPNQVSGMLGLGVFMALVGLVLFKVKSKYSIYFGIVAMLFTALSMMTFSRGGLYNAAGGFLILVIYGFRDITTAMRRLAPPLIVIVLFALFILPVLDDFTGGALLTRFEDTGTTKRGDIAHSDLEIFLANPVFGVGVGNAYALRESILDYKAISHTELSRLLSEHGSFGLAALITMFFMGVQNLRRPNSRPGKAFIAGAMAWSVFFMLNAGMRLAAPSFMWGLSFVTIVNLQRGLTAVRRNREETESDVRPSDES